MEQDDRVRVLDSVFCIIHFIGLFLLSNYGSCLPTFRFPVVIICKSKTAPQSKQALHSVVYAFGRNFFSVPFSTNTTPPYPINLPSSMWSLLHLGQFTGHSSFLILFYQSYCVMLSLCGWYRKSENTAVIFLLNPQQHSD